MSQAASYLEASFQPLIGLIKVIQFNLKVDSQNDTFGVTGMASQINKTLVRPL